MHMTMMNIE